MYFYDSPSRIITVGVAWHVRMRPRQQCRRRGRTNIAFPVVVRQFSTGSFAKPSTGLLLLNVNIITIAYHLTPPPSPPNHARRLSNSIIFDVICRPICSRKSLDISNPFGRVNFTNQMPVTLCVCVCVAPIIVCRHAAPGNACLVSSFAFNA